jgi:uncharacterized damage-inducible protein DinB
MDVSSDALAAAVIQEVRRRLFAECVPRLKTCLSLLADEEIWYRPNAETVSIGNLVLHLCGNVRQWVLSGLGGQPDTRRRQAEFDEPGPLPASELLQRLDAVMADVARLLDRLTAWQLLDRRRVQGFDETGVAILIHVTEHFSYHVGQITYAVKSRKAIDVGYYKGVDLGRTG